MGSRYEFTSAGTGFTLDMPGATAGGGWEEPLTEWGLGLGDSSATALVIQDSLPNLKKLLEGALAAVEYRLTLERTGDLREVTVDDKRYTVPSGEYREGMGDDEVWRIAVRIQEDVAG